MALGKDRQLAWNPLHGVVSTEARVAEHTARHAPASGSLRAVLVDMVLDGRLIAEHAPGVVRSIGLRDSTIFDPVVQGALGASAATHDAANGLLRRPTIEAEAQRDLTTWLAQHGIALTEAALARQPDLGRRDARAPHRSLGAAAVPLRQVAGPGGAGEESRR